MRFQPSPLQGEGVKDSPKGKDFSERGVDRDGGLGYRLLLPWQPAKQPGGAEKNLHRGVDRAGKLGYKDRCRWGREAQKKRTAL